MTTIHRVAKRHLPSTWVSLGLGILAIAAAGCSLLPGPTARPSPSSSPPPPGPLVSVETRGGHCVGGPCGSVVVLDTDGRVHAAAKPPNDLGTVPETDVAGLIDLIAATDFAALRSHPFTGTCPVAFDGQEIVYEFTTNHGVERIESCVTEVDPKAPLFAAVAGVLVDFMVLPTE